jgi:bifunctional non-homologous end joining protein LigD
LKSRRSPETGKKPRDSALNFVVQKHNAKNLHYDFRLEVGGVLKSWAIPKGPSLNPSEKRLAMMVEDHPFDYKNFEGVIPKSEYGSGEVLVWDNGIYHSITSEDKEESEKVMQEGLTKGEIKFLLHGKKLKGAFALVKMKGRGGNAWLLIKHRDAFASEGNVLEQDQSVLSGNTIRDLQNNR